MAFRRLGDLIGRYLGIGGATGDAANPLSVRGPGSLHDGDTGGHRIRVNKSAVGDTASFLFQTSFSGRAEFGTLGSDNFGLKVSTDGSAFTDVFSVSGSGTATFQQDTVFTGGVGIGGASPNSTNRLSVNTEAALFNSVGGSIRVTVNKAAATDTGSLVFQTNWSGRAEMGLAGNDNFSIKTSNGTSWFSALECSGTNGRVSFPAGVSGHIPVFDTGMSVFIGEGAGSNDGLANNYNTFIGFSAGQANATGRFNCAIGVNALRDSTSGENNCALGVNALRGNTTGNNNSVTGVSALRGNTTGGNNSATGVNALRGNTTGGNNSAIGVNALLANTTGHSNSAMGRDALRNRVDGTPNTNYSNCVGLGFGTRVSASNQVQLGNSSCTVYAHGAVQNRSDVRDKADIRDTVLGLDFITGLRPVDFCWDMRDYYFDRVEEKDLGTGEMEEKLVPVKKDGSRKRKRYHHGLIAQEVEALLKRTGVDFGGFQNHARAGGDEVMSLGYSELIAPLIKAVQELAARVAEMESKHES